MEIQICNMIYIIIHPAHAEVTVRNDVPVVGGSLSLVQAA